MKKTLLICCVVLVLLLMGVVMLIFNPSIKVGNFEIATYSRYVERFPSEKIFGEICDEKKAKEKAESLFYEIYGDSIKAQKPFTVLFDEEAQVWLVQGTLPRNHEGGVAHTLIRKSDGKVLAVWHDK